ncbi:MAG: LysR family transcriptional regulator, partial [Gallionella sp.]
MLHFTLRQLQVFEKVAKHLSYSRAAEELYLSQPAVSMQIKQLERHVGLPLLEQMGKKIFLTVAGRELFQYAHSISIQLSEIESVLDELKGLKQGKFTLSVVNTANYFTPQLLAKYCKRYPGINVNLLVANRDAVLGQLADNTTDLAIMGQPPDGIDVSAESFLDNPLVVIAAPDHPLASIKRIKFARLASETFLSREPGSGTRSAMERSFAEHNVQPRISMEMETNEAIKQAVQAGMGLGILSLHSVELELEAGRLVVLDVEDFPLRRNWFVVHRSNKRLSGAVLAFKDYL